MNRKALVLALGTVFMMTGAYAQKSGAKDKGDSASDPDSVVELYGKVYPEIVRPQGKGATSAGSAVATFAAPPTGVSSIITRNEMESSNSRFGVRGSEKLGAGLKAIFQLETAFSVDSNNSAFAQRDSFVGLSHNAWGTIKLGRMDTPFKAYGDDISFLGVSSGNFTSTSNVLRKPGFGTSSASSFHLRRVNVAQYESPQFAGLDFAVQYSTDEADTASRHPHVWSGGIKYEMGPLTLAIAHERHWDLFGGSRNVPTAAMSNFADQSVNSKDQATQAMVKWRLSKVHQFEFDYIRKEYKENATVTGRFASYKNNAWMAIWDMRWTPQWRTQLHYIKSEKGSCSRVAAVCVTDGLDGTQLSAGFAYYFSSRTYLFAMASWVKNGFSAVYNNSNQQAPSTGEDITQYALGIQHTF